jgi:hypothetical protein
MEASDGFVPITAMFYSVFHPTEGTKIIHQVPSGVIVPPSNDDNRINNNLPDSSAFDQPLFDFDIVKNYVIPKPSLCNKLITLKIDKYRIVGFPVNIYASHYARNSFGFNFCFVFSYESDTTPYEGSVKRIGKMFRALEEQSQLLSKSLKDSHLYYQQNNNNLNSNQSSNNQMAGKFNTNNKYLRIIDDWDDAGNQIVLEKQAPGLDIFSQFKISSIESLIQQIYQDLNNYSECMIPIDASNSVDLKLFPISPPPPQVHSYDVPIALVKLDSLIDSLWDPTMLKIVPFINGINSISKISILSNANLDLTKECIRHLLHYKSITLLDIFQFSNHYVVTSSIGNFLRDSKMAKNCQDYILSIKGTFSGLPLEPTHHRNSASNSVNSKLDSFTTQVSTSYSSTRTPKKPQLLTMDSGLSHPFSNKNHQQINKIILPSKATLFQLYNSLNSNMSVSQWYSENEKLLENIDIRKFITFGVRNGIISRVHKYPVYSKLEVDDIKVHSGVSKTGFDFKDDNGKSNKISTAAFNISSLPVLSDSKLVPPKITTENTMDRIKGIKKAGLSMIKSADNFKEFNNIENDSQNIDTSTSNSTDSDEESDSSSDSKHLEKIDSLRSEKQDTFLDENIQKIKKREKEQEQKLLRCMKHTQHMDAICTIMRLSMKEVHSILERIGEVEMIER